MHGLFYQSLEVKRVFIAILAMAVLMGCVRENGIEETQRLTLKASVESGQLAFHWTKGDAIVVNTSEGFVTFGLKGEGGSSEGEFEGYHQGTLGETALYPSDIPATIDGSALNVALPSQYTYVEGRTNAVLHASVNGDKLYFKHLTALLKVDVMSVPEGASLVITAPERKINGVLTADLSSENPSLATAEAKSAEESTVRVVFHQFESHAQIFVPVPVGEYSVLNIHVEDQDGNLIEGTLSSTAEAKVISRASVEELPEIEMELPTLEFKERACNMEKVTLTYENIPAAHTVVIDFGDGTPEVAASGSGSVVHQFENNSGADQTFAVTLTTGGMTVKKDIYVYSLTALTEVARRFSTGECDDVWVMAHRANTSDKSIPENSIPAVMASIAAGVQMVETDTRLTSDGEIVICHDESIKRTTNGTGNISDLTLAQIRSYNLKDRNGKVTTEVMPTLREFLEAARGKIYVNLDYSPRTASTAQVMSVVEELGMYEQVLFYCNSATKVNEVGAINPNAHAYAWFTHHAALKQLPGEHFMQCTYTAGSPTNVSESLANGMICTVNMLNGVSDSYIQMDKLDQLFEYFPSTRVIQTDVSDKLVDVLKGYPYEEQEPGEYFVSPSGAGDRSGDSWDNAMGMDQWRTMVSSSFGAKTYSQSAMLDESTFYFMEGSYCVPSEEYGMSRVEFQEYGQECCINIVGGYDSSSKGTDLSKRNPDVNQTVFTGDLNGNGKADAEDAGMFCLDAFARLKIDGVTFAHSYGRSTWDQNAFMLNSATSGAQAIIDLVDCRFHDIYGFKDSNTKYHGGAAVWVGKNAQANLHKCEIYDCHSHSRGGAIRIAESTGIVFMNECVLRDNAITDRFGSAVHVTSGSIMVNNCTFAHNVGSYAVLNGSGNWLLVNSTIVADYVSSVADSNMAWRSESGSDRTVAMINSIMLFDGYTSVHVNGSSYIFTSLGFNLTGSNNSYFTPAATDKTGCTASGLGLSWDDSGYYNWNGTAENFTKATLSDVENAVKNGCNRSAGSYSNIGLGFYNWLQEIGEGKNPLANDQNGNPRTTSAMWPGAYEGK